MSKLAKKRIHNFNRYLIILLTIAGFWGDGMQASDLLFLAATIFWIWQPEIDKFDERVLRYLNK